MTVTWKICAVLLLSLMSAVTVAQGKVAIVDIQGAMLGTEVAKQSIAKLEKNPEFAAMKAKRDGLVADMKALAATEEKNQMTWSPEQLTEHRKKAEYLRADYELVGKKLQSESQVVLQQVAQNLTPKTRTALDQLIAVEGIGLLLNSQAAIHAAPEFDITSKLTDMLNKAK